MLRFPHFKLTSKSSETETINNPAAAPVNVAAVLHQALEANNEQEALAAIKKIPSIDAAKRIQASVDIYLTFHDAINEEDLEELRETVTLEMLGFSGERLPNDIAQAVGVPEECIKETFLTGVVDYADVRAAIKVWDEVDRSEVTSAILAAFIDQYRDSSPAHKGEAALLGQAFRRSLQDGAKISSNERRILKALQSTGNPRHLDEKRHDEALRIASERDQQRKIQRELAAHAVK